MSTRNVARRSRRADRARPTPDLEGARETADRDEGIRAEWRSLRALVGRTGVRGIIGDVYRLFMANNLLTYASAIAFQTLFALITLSFTGLALLGFLELEEVWRRDLAPQIADRTSDAAFTVIDNAVSRVLSSQRGFWLTLGAALAVWNVSSGVRGAMGAVDDIYDVRSSRSLVSRLAVSIGLAVPLSLLFVGAVVAAQLTPRLVRGLDPGAAASLGARVAGWVLAVALLTVAVWLLVRFAPSRRQPASLVSVASLLIVGFWLVASLAFGLYATTIASYGTVFGGLAVAFVLLVYISISSIAFLAGIQADAYLRGSGTRPGPADGGSERP
jgi:membrane protein